MSEKTILYVEDNEANRMIVRDLLKRTTYQLIEAHDGEAGVAKAIEIRPDLVLMDIQLPKISGLDAIKRLRAEASTANTPIIAIIVLAHTTDNRPEQRVPIQPSRLGSEGKAGYLFARMFMMSPSLTVYVLPSSRSTPFAFASS